MEKMSVSEMVDYLKENPDAIAQVFSSGTVSPSPVSIPEFEIDEGAMIYFKNGKPDAKVRDYLKSLGFTFRPASTITNNRAYWIGSKAKLIGTPFDKE